MKKKFYTDVEKNQEVTLEHGRKRLMFLEALKSCGCPFTNAMEVEKDMKDTDITNIDKQNRMKKEMQFAPSPNWTPSLGPRWLKPPGG